MNFLILLPTFNRPEMVKTAINSVYMQGYQDYTLVIIDDNEEPTLPSYAYQHPRTIVYFTGDSIETKRKNGSRHGQFMNHALDTFDADIAVILCDDDALCENYLSKLNFFYEHNPEVMYSYSHVRVFNPDIETIEEVGDRVNDNPYNHTGNIDPVCRVDASQVTWRIGEDRFANQTRNLDADMWKKLRVRHGLCPFNGIMGQYKALFPGQLGQREDDFDTV